MRKTMAPHKNREIVIEFEKVQMIRKRARTVYTYCPGCRSGKDFVGLRAAAELFGITVDVLGSFVSANSVHVASVGTSGSGICVASLLKVIHSKQSGNRPRLILSKNSVIS